VPAPVEALDRPLTPPWAAGIYPEPRRPTGTLDNARLAILTDALLDSGCKDKYLIQPGRGSWPHVRGCRAVDALLEKG
jgi:hypothetical protein